MCGIAGIYHGNAPPPAPDQLAAMSRALSHRGPDGDAVFRDARVSLAHRRLAIIDPSAGQQPFFSDDRSIVLVYNGEVYNYREIRRELESEVRFSTESDTEVVLRAYERWGIDCLARFRGMFAFALYDARRQRLYLVRDRVGVKPLYYARAGSRLAFASELAALMRLEWVSDRIDRGALAQFLRYIYVPAPLSIYEGVRKLEAGHYLEVDTANGEVLDRQYWQLQVRMIDRPESDWLEELEATLDDVVRLYVRSDVPFGSFLSGGVDSSLVTALMAKQLDEPVRTFTIGFAEHEYSELAFAEEASRAVGARHHAKVVSPDLAAELLETMAIHFGEPFSDASAVPTYYVSREAAREVKMVLSGDGGDELFAGYDSYERAIRSGEGHLGFRARLAGLLGAKSASRPEPLAQHDASRTQFDDASIEKLLPGVELPGRVRVDPSAFVGPADEVTRFQAEDFKVYLPNDVLTKVDRMSMANSLEVRVPLLDHVLVELAFSMPLGLKLRDVPSRGLVRKYLLKRVAGRFFPERFLDRPKWGFGVPLGAWCGGPLAPLLRERLTDRANPLFQLVDYRATQEVVAPVLSGGGDAAKAWSLLMLDAWRHAVHTRGEHAVA